MTEPKPTEDSRDLKQLQKKADRQKGEWPQDPATDDTPAGQAAPKSPDA